MQSLDITVNNYQVTLDDQLFSLLSSKRAKIVELLAQGCTNKVIASQLGIATKTVESNLKQVNQKFLINNLNFESLYSNFGNRKLPSYNLRLRLLAYLVSQNLINYRNDNQNLTSLNLNQALKQVLTLVGSGLSNILIAELLKISQKTVEQRLSQLYDFFNIETNNLNETNPRVALFARSLLRTDLKVPIVRKLFKETFNERVVDIVANSEEFIINLEKDHSYIG